MGSTCSHGSTACEGNRDVLVAGGGKTFTATKVTVTHDVAAYEVVLVPVVRGLEAVVAASPPKFGSVPVTVEDRRGELVHLALLPATRCQEDVRFMPPLWCVDKRDGEEPNMEMDTIDLNLILSILHPNEDKAVSRPARNVTSNIQIPGECV